MSSENEPTLTEHDSVLVLRRRLLARDSKLQATGPIREPNFRRINMPSARVNGTKLYYEFKGRGPTAFFIHGMCGNANVWDGQVALLRQARTCLTYDRRGHTRSPLGDVAGRTVEMHADDAAALVKELRVGPCQLVGSSGGARVGVDLLRRYPELFTTAVLSEPPIFGLDPERGGKQIMADLRPPLEAALQKNDPRAAVDAFFEYMCPGLWSRLDDKGKEPYRANHAELLPDLQMPPYAITVQDLAAIRTPCVVVSGSESHPVLRRVARVIAESMPNGRLVELAGVGHVTYAEAPEEFARLVLDRC
jgi:3-oxoadipate enol-lactonase